MIDELLPYYERELAFIRQMSGEFAAKYPKVAGRLKLEPNACEDPHVERLIEAFALLAGRIHHKLDDEFPEISEAILDALYPHFLRPVPSMAIVQFHRDPSQSNVAAAIETPRGTVVNASPPGGDTCSFRTCYPVALLPMRVVDASVAPPGNFSSAGLSGDTAAVIRIEMECTGGLRLSSLPVQSIRFYLDGDSSLVHALYDALFRHSLRVTVRETPASSDSARVILPPTALRPVGFAEDEGVLPYSDRSFLGYRLIQEYFAFPDKFLFFDISGLERTAGQGIGGKFEVLISLKRLDQPHRLVMLEQGVNANTFKPGCTPVVNLFETIAEPVRVNQTKSEYRVIPDQHRPLSTEVYSIDRVASATSYMEEPQTYEPFYALRHGAEDGSADRYWYAHRRSSFRKDGDKGTEVYITLVDTNYRASAPETDVLSLHITCTNRDYVSRLRFDGTPGEMQAEDVRLVRTSCARKPTAPVRPPLRRGLQWRLISHLSLNYLSIVDQGRDALVEILRLYNFGDDPTVRKQIEGIRSVSSRPAMSRVRFANGFAFCRGTDVAVEFDEDQYVGTGMFLFASVLERFVGLYSAVNAFTRFKAVTNKGVLKQWPPRAGVQILL